MDWRKILYMVAGLAAVAVVSWALRAGQDRSLELEERLEIERSLRISYEHKYKESMRLIEELSVVEREVTKKPDGTVIEKVKETKKTAKVSRRKTDKESVRHEEKAKMRDTRKVKKVTKTRQSRYTLGLSIPPASMKSPTPIDSLYFEAGFRLGGLPLFLTLGGGVEPRWMVGVRYEW